MSDPHNMDQSQELDSISNVSRVNSSIDSVEMMPLRSNGAHVEEPADRDDDIGNVADEVFGETRDVTIEEDQSEAPQRRRPRSTNATVTEAMPIITISANTDSESSISTERPRFQSPPRPSGGSSSGKHSPVRRPSMYNLAMYNELYDDEEFFNDGMHLPSPPPIADDFIITTESSSSAREDKKNRQKRKTLSSAISGVTRKKRNTTSADTNPLLDTHASNASSYLDSTETLYQNPSTNTRGDDASGTHYGTISGGDAGEQQPILSNPNRKSLALWNGYVRDFVLPKKLEDANEVLQLGPLQKLIKYRKIPWKLLIDLILCVLLFVFVTLLSMSRKKFIQANSYGFVLTFLPDDFEDMKESVEGFNTYYFLTKDEMQDHIKSVVHTYENFEATSVGTYATRKQIWMETTLWDDDYAIRQILVPGYEVYNSTTGQLNEPPTIATSHTNSFPYILNKKRIVRENLTVEHPYGIFARDGVEGRHLFDQLVESTIILNFENLDTNKGTVRKPQCFNWTLMLKYDFSVRSSRLPCKVTYEYRSCSESKYSVYEAKFNTSVTYIAIAVAALSSISLLLNLKAVISRVILFVKQKRRKDQVTISWSKFFWAYFSFWFPLALTKDFCNVLGTIMWVMSTRGGVSYEVIVTITLGIGCLTSFFSIIRYLQYIPKFYILIMTIRISIPFALRYLTGVMPLFLGYTLASVVWFGHYVPYFSTIDIAMVSNFCCLHGDVIRDTFDMLYGWSPLSRVWGRIYLYSFVLLFITVILTMFLLIIEDAYFGLWAQKEGSGSKTLTASQAKPSVVIKNDDLMESFLSPHFQDEETPGSTNTADQEENIQDTDAVIAQYYTEEAMSPKRRSSLDDLHTLEHVYIRALLDTIQRKVTRRKGIITEKQQLLLQQMWLYAKDCTSGNDPASRLDFRTTGNSAVF